LALEVVPARVRNDDPLVTAADQFSVPPPLFDMPIVWLKGPLPPATAENDSDAGVTLIVGVGAGLSIDNTIDRIVNEPSKQIMAYEFKIYLHEIKMGLTRADALHQLYYRTQSKSVKSFADGILQSVKTGMALGSVLQIIRRDIYESIRNEAEKRAMKAPVVMMFPLVFFIFPTVFIIVVGPTLLILVGEMKKMSF
jgi:tight adherence protein C